MSNETSPGPSQFPGQSMDDVESERTILVVDLEDDSSDEEITVKEEIPITTCLVPFLPRLPVNGGVHLMSSTHKLLLQLLQGNAETQHSAVNDDSNSVPCNSRLHPPLRPAETTTEAIADELECFDLIQNGSPSKPNQTNSEANGAEEPQCLGPFVKSSSLKCPKCSVILTDYHQIFTHPCTDKNLARELNKKKPVCFFCGTEFADKIYWKKHTVSHFQKTYVKCSICGKCLNSKSSFRIHALTHTNRWPYRCDICGRGAANERQLEAHRASHSDERSWMCDICGAMFHSQVRLIKHKTVHDERKYECDKCFLKFKTRHQLTKHKKRHSARVRFQCGECSSSFSDKWTLKCHKELKHDDNSGGESFICSVCNREFKHRFAFKTHMYLHKAKKERVLFTCNICKRNFVSKQTLGRHIAEHNGKQFSCTHCGMLFTQKGSVKRHILKLHPSQG